MYSRKQHWQQLLRPPAKAGNLRVPAGGNATDSGIPSRTPGFLAALETSRSTGRIGTIFACEANAQNLLAIHELLLQW